MAYTWQNGELITAEKLNSMGGILPVTFTRTEVQDNNYIDAIYTSDLTVEEIREQQLNYKIPILNLKIDEIIQRDRNTEQHYVLDLRGISFFIISTIKSVEELIGITPTDLAKEDIRIYNNHLYKRIELQNRK